MIFLATALILASTLLLMFMAVVGLLRRRLSSVVFFATAGYAFVAAANAEDLIGQFGEDTYFQMSLIYVIASIVLSISVQFFSEFVPRLRLSLPVWNQHDFQWHATLATVLALASATLIIFSRGGNLFLNWADARESNDFLTALATLLFMLASPGIISAFYAKRRALGVILLLLCLGLFVVIGSRASLLGALIFGMWLMLVRAKGVGSRLRVVVIALVLTFAIHTFLRSLRGFGIGGLLKAFDEGNLLAALLSPQDDVDVSGGEAHVPDHFMFSITQSSIDNFGFMTSIQRLILLPLPSVKEWITKPMDVTAILWNKAFESGLLNDAQGQALLLESYITGKAGSLHPTFFGEYFLAGGWIALVLSIVVLGAVFVAIDFFMHRADRLTALALCGPVLIGYLFVARGSSVAGFGFIVYLGVMVGLLRYFVKCVRRLCVAATTNNSSSPETTRHA